ncbi:MAG: SDR family NAD(P)-dependent oxidoreductase [Betaproteobacteria bacterium]|nr:SDR family NAD(P)-dependent oxidoreductase [Betaproteobacteria bacterium]
MDLFIVTGTTNGIGAALKDALAARPGVRLVCLSRAASSIEPVRNVHIDFRNSGALDAAFASAVERAGEGPFRRAILINNAGVAQPVARFDQQNAQDLSGNLTVNVIAPMLLTSLFANAFRPHAQARLVVNISSGAAKRAIAGWSAYCTAKAALEMATRVAALEAEPGLSICSLAPGVVDTPMQAVVRSADPAAFPDRPRFEAMKNEGALRPAADVAEDILAAIDAGRLANGGNFDLRELNG